jgi:hypothetical protein
MLAALRHLPSQLQPQYSSFLLNKVARLPLKIRRNKMKALRFLKGFGIVATATFWFIIGCEWLLPGSFSTNSILSLVALTLLITTLAYIGFYVVGLAIVVPLKIKEPGLLLQLYIGTEGGALAILTSRWLLPHAVLVHSQLVMIAYAFANTVFTMLLAFQAGQMRKPIRLLPRVRSCRSGSME